MRKSSIEQTVESGIFELIDNSFNGLKIDKDLNSLINYVKNNIEKIFNYKKADFIVDKAGFSYSDIYDAYNHKTDTTVNGLIDKQITTTKAKEYNKKVLENIEDDKNIELSKILELIGGDNRLLSKFNQETIKLKNKLSEKLGKDIGNLFNFLKNLDTNTIRPNLNIDISSLEKIELNKNEIDTMNSIINNNGDEDIIKSVYSNVSKIINIYYSNGNINIEDIKNDFKIILDLYNEAKDSGKRVNNLGDILNQDDLINNITNYQNSFKRLLNFYDNFSNSLENNSVEKNNSDEEANQVEIYNTREYWDLIYNELDNREKQFLGLFLHDYDTSYKNNKNRKLSKTDFIKSFQNIKDVTDIKKTIKSIYNIRSEELSYKFLEKLEIDKLINKLFQIEQTAFLIAFNQILKNNNLEEKSEQEKEEEEIIEEIDKEIDNKDDKRIEDLKIQDFNTCINKGTKQIIELIEGVKNYMSLSDIDKVKYKNNNNKNIISNEDDLYLRIEEIVNTFKDIANLFLKNKLLEKNKKFSKAYELYIHKFRIDKITDISKNQSQIDLFEKIILGKMNIKSAKTLNDLYRICLEAINNEYESIKELLKANDLKFKELADFKRNQSQNSGGNKRKAPEKVEKTINNNVGRGRRILEVLANENIECIKEQNIITKNGKEKYGVLHTNTGKTIIFSNLPNKTIHVFSQDMIEFFGNNEHVNFTLNELIKNNRNIYKGVRISGEGVHINTDERLDDGWEFRLKMALKTIPTNIDIFNELYSENIFTNNIFSELIKKGKTSSIKDCNEIFKSFIKDWNNFINDFTDNDSTFEKSKYKNDWVKFAENRYNIVNYRINNTDNKSDEGNINKTKKIGSIKALINSIANYDIGEYNLKAKDYIEVIFDALEYNTTKSKSAGEKGINSLLSIMTDYKPKENPEVKKEFIKHIKEYNLSTSEIKNLFFIELSKKQKDEIEKKEKSGSTKKQISELRKKFTSEARKENISNINLRLKNEGKDIRINDELVINYKNLIQILGGYFKHFSKEEQCNYIKNLIDNTSDEILEMIIDKRFD